MRIPRVRRLLIALIIGVAAPIAPVVTYAGGGVGGGGNLGGLLIAVDHASPPGHNYGFLDYYSRSVTVHQGDTVTWQFASGAHAEVHTVSFVPAGVPLKPGAINRFYPGVGNPIPDPDDGAHAGPAVPLGRYQIAGCGNSPFYPGTGPCSFDGHSAVNSGLLLPSPKPGIPASAFSLRINAAPGVYHYFCLIHGPSMSGTIRVVAASAPSDTQASIDAHAAAQYHAGVTHALAHEAKIHPPAVTIGGHTLYTVLAGGGYGRVTYDEFIPSHINLKPGDSVNWAPGGFHTVTFPAESGASAVAAVCEKVGQDRAVRNSLVGCTGLEEAINPAGAFPNGPPGKAYTGGFYNSGILVIPKPHPWSASFPSAGTFRYDCLIHPGMDAVITTG